jgi:hypothetical protein
MFYLEDAINPPNIAPKIMLANGFEVIGQEPVLQPTNLKYRKPATPPITIPRIVRKIILLKIILILSIKIYY